MKHTLSLIVLLVAMPCSALAANGAGPVAMVDGASVAAASLVSVDQETRVIILAGPEGDHWAFTAGPEVQNFDQIKRGDRVIASYFAGFAIGLGPRGSGVKNRLDTLEISTAQKGLKFTVAPGGMEIELVE